jgi:cysteine-S-conjugate beta-lyase
MINCRTEISIVGVVMRTGYFDEKVDRINTDCYKWDYNEAMFGTNDLIPLWVADMDFKSPPAVIEALRVRAEHGIFGYTFHGAEFQEAIINWQKNRHGWLIGKDEIVLTPGVVPGLNFVLQTFSEPGDKVLFLTPVYDPFYVSVKRNDRKPVNSDLILEDNQYKIDFDDLEKKSRDARILLFCSPHNPVGRVWTVEELEKIAEICLKNSVLIVSDEIHSDLIFKQYKHTPLAMISEEICKNTITFNAPSKTFNIAGLSTSYAVIKNETLRKKFTETLERNWLMSGNIFGLLALESAYREGYEWLLALLKYLEENYVFLTEFLQKYIPQIISVKMEGTYLAWLDCRDLEMDQKALNDFFIHKAKVGLTDGEQYGKAGRGFMRLNFGCSREILQKAMERIYQALNKSE